MHISEGVITGVPAAGFAAAGLGLMGIGAWRMNKFTQDHPERKPLLGMGGAFIFFVSLLPLPAFTGTCSHPCGTPLAGILLGPWIGIALAGLSLLLQAAFFAHGGFSTWGANVIVLGIGGSVFGWLTFHIARKSGLSIRVAAGAGGLIGDVVTYALAGFILSSVLAHSPSPQYSWREYLSVIYAAYLPTQGPLAILEMIVTGLAIHYIHRQRPEVLESLGVIPKGSSDRIPIALFLVAILSAVLLATALPASADNFAGMDEAVNEKMAEGAGAAPRAPYINTEEMGDLWNALLLLAGGVCGFVVGRRWDMLFGKPAPKNQTPKKE